MSLVIKPIIKKDIDSVVRIHIAAFPDFFLTQLGCTFLQFYYKSVLKHKLGIMMGAFNDAGLIGFCAATQLSKSFNSSLIINNPFLFSFVGVRLLFTNPKAIIRLLKNLTKSDSEVEDDGSYAEILSICVDPNQQGDGVGKKLLKAVEEELNKDNIKRLSLTTDYDHNENTISFYKSLEFKIMYVFETYPNRKMYRLIKNI